MLLLKEAKEAVLLKYFCARLLLLDYSAYFNYVIQ